MTDSFGARLRQERERQHITLAQLASVTKIKASLFEGLERDDVSRWPAGIFRRSFIRAYAEAIGLDAEAVCQEFVDRHPEPGERARPTNSRSKPASSTVTPSERPENETSEPTPALRLMLADSSWPFSTGRLLRRPGQRWRAMAWDLGSLLVLALTLFLVFDSFWMPLAVTSLCYYLGGMLILGNAPGVWLFASRPRKSAPDEAVAERYEAGRSSQWAEPFEGRLRPLDDDSPAALSLTSRAVAYPPVGIDGTRARA